MLSANVTFLENQLFVIGLVTFQDLHALRHDVIITFTIRLARWLGNIQSQRIDISIHIASTKYIFPSGISCCVEMNSSISPRFYVYKHCKLSCDLDLPSLLLLHMKCSPR